MGHMGSSGSASRSASGASGRPPRALVERRVCDYRHPVPGNGTVSERPRNLDSLSTSPMRTLPGTRDARFESEMATLASLRVVTRVPTGAAPSGATRSIRAGATNQLHRITRGKSVAAGAGTTPRTAGVRGARSTTRSRTRATRDDEVQLDLLCHAYDSSENATRHRVLVFFWFFVLAFVRSRRGFGPRTSTAGPRSQPCLACRTRSRRRSRAEFGGDVC